MKSRFNDEPEFKQKAYEMMVEEGLILQETSFFDLKTDKERFERISTLIRQGWRVQKLKEQVAVINLVHSPVFEEDVQEVLEIYRWCNQ